jgi:hypothetical protein
VLDHRLSTEAARGIVKDDDFKSLHGALRFEAIVMEVKGQVGVSGRSAVWARRPG